MTARSVQVTVQNDTEFAMVKNFAHLCWGDWTPGMPEPPDRIEPHGEMTFRAESGGPTSGTEGYVKYNLQTNFVDQSGFEKGPEIVYVYFNNPFLLNTAQVVGQCATGDITPGCDYERRSGDNPFSRTDNAVFEVVRANNQTQGPGGASWGDALVGQMTAGVWLYLRASGAEREHAVVVLRVTRKVPRQSPAPVPQFLPTEAPVFAPMAGQTTSLWSGDWEASRPDDAGHFVNLSISNSPKGLAITLDDRSSRTPVSISNPGLQAFTGFGSPHLDASWPSLSGTHQRVAPHEPTGLKMLLTPNAGEVAHLHVPGAAPATHIEKAVMHTLPVDRVVLGPTLAIELYGEFVSGRLVLPWIRYLNWDVHNHGSTDLLLKRIPHVH